MKNEVPDDTGSSQETSSDEIRSLHREDTTHTIGRTLSRTHSIAGDEELTRILTGTPQTYNNPLPSMGGGRQFPLLIKDQESYRVDFDGDDDPLLSYNWSVKKKVFNTSLLTFSSFTVAWGSSIYGPAMQVIEKEFHVGVTPAALGVSLYVLGFATGPCCWGPMSELKGRRYPLILAMFLFSVFSFGAGVSKDIQSLMICRFFAGATGAAAFTVVPAAFADMYQAATRGKASAFFTLAVNGGPMVAPVAGAYIVNSYLSWRWVQYITGILAVTALGLVAFFFEEPYHPVILVKKAEELRVRTGNWALYAPQENVSLDMKNVFTNTVARPIKMLGQEPILLLVSIYNGFVYAILYMCLEAIPIVFRLYDFKGGNIMLPYLSIFVGSVICIIVNITYFEKKYRNDLTKHGKAVLPESRLYLMMYSSVIFTISMFWLFWTGYYHEHIHWICPVIALSLFGIGFVGLFLPVINYILDSYLMLAASAISANTFLRSAMAAAFPLFTSQMFNNLGVQWAGTLIGCISAVLMPVPFLFFIYGKRIRGMSKYAINLEEAS